MDIHNIINSTIDSISNGYFNELFINPIYIAILITIIIILIIVCIYEENRLIKTSFYILCITLVIIFIHNKLLLLMYKTNLNTIDSNNILYNIDNRDRYTTGGVNNRPEDISNSKNNQGVSSDTELSYLNNI